MKRCPQCLFIYPESDQRCDFDNTPLVAVKDSEIDAATKPRRNPTKLIVLAVAVVLALASFVVYKTANKSDQSVTDIPVVTARSALRITRTAGPFPFSLRLPLTISKVLAHPGCNFTYAIKSESNLDRHNSATEQGSHPPDRRRQDRR